MAVRLRRRRYRTRGSQYTYVIYGITKKKAPEIRAKLMAGETVGVHKVIDRPGYKELTLSLTTRLTSPFNNSIPLLGHGGIPVSLPAAAVPLFNQKGTIMNEELTQQICDFAKSAQL